MEIWKATAGIILLVVGIVVAWQSYVAVSQCNSFWGKLWTGITSLFGGTQAQACYNAWIIEVAGIIAAMAGLVIAVTAFMKPKKR